MTFDWNQARAFLATAEHGSFSAAARALNLTQPTLGRQVSALEQSLGLVLFERIGTRLVLTPTGQDFLEQVRPMGEAANRAALVASGRAVSVAGEVCISVTDIFACYVMPAVVQDLYRIAPQIRVKVLAENNLSDLQRREADIAIRHVAPTQPELISRKVREAKGLMYAAQSYLDAHGAIITREDMANAQLISMGDSEALINHLRKMELPVTEANVAFTVESGVGAWEMARQGLGVMPMMDDLADHFDNMVPLIDDLAPIPVPYWLTSHRELQTSKRIRLVFDHLVEVLSQPTLPIRGATVLA